MTYIVLDTTVIFGDPKLLALRLPDTTFIIPVEVFVELDEWHRRLPETIMYLIHKAKVDGVLLIIDTDLPPFTKYKGSMTSSSRSNIAIVSAALSYLENGQTVKIATNEGYLTSIALNKKIDILTYEERKELLSQVKTSAGQKTSAQSKIRSFEKGVVSKVLIDITIGVATTIAAKVTYQFADRIFSTLYVWGTIVLILFIGIGLFILREKLRLSYGIFEFLVGVFAIILLFQPNKFNYSTIDFNLDFSIKLLGGLYIMVRGQDNIVKAIQDTRAGMYLRNKFGIGE